MYTFIVLLILLLLALTIVIIMIRNQNSPKKLSSPMCTSNECALFPVTDPAFNLRETAKQMLLLEDHLTNYGKQCAQCIKKHCLTIEAYLEEALCLDCDNRYTSEINDLLNNFKNIERDFVNGIPNSKLSQDLRTLRKKIHVKYFTVGL